MTESEPLDLKELYTTPQFRNKVLEVILLLIGLHLLNIAAAAIPSFIDIGEWYIPLIKYHHLVENGIFGIVIYSMTKQNTRVTFAVGLLSAMEPLCGSLFYLLLYSVNATRK